MYSKLYSRPALLRPSRSRHLTSTGNLIAKLLSLTFKFRVPARSPKVHKAQLGACSVAVRVPWILGAHDMLSNGLSEFLKG